MADILDTGTERLAILNLHVTPMPPIKFRLNLTYHLEEMWFEEFLGYWNKTFLAILNFRSGAEDFLRWLPWWSSWISEQNFSSSSKSPCCLNAFHLSYHSIRLTVWEQITIKDFQDGPHGYHHGYDSDGDACLLVAHFENIVFYIGSSYSKYRLFTGFSIKNIG